MIDYRMNTFLTLCDTMHYRRAAEKLNVTQPAVTQHIQYLEKHYDCELFQYNGRKLEKTEAGKLLEIHARTEKYNELSIKAKLHKDKRMPLKIGATKTIGDYVLTKTIPQISKEPSYDLTVVVDNTKNLLDMLEHHALNFAMIEGFFDKRKYGHRLFKKERFVGVCSEAHPFAGRTVSIDALFDETLLVREEGSGTRAIFEQMLLEHNYSLGYFSHMICLSSFQLIQACILENVGITFAYESFSSSRSGLSTFNVQDMSEVRDFYFVYLMNTNVDQLIRTLSF